MFTGVVKFYNQQKGFGFIVPEGTLDDIFVHVSAIQRSGLGELTSGQNVRFDLEPSRKSGKMAACNLELV